MVRNKSTGFVFAAALFLVAAVVSTLLFVRAAQLRQRARETDCAVVVLQTAIEEFKVGYTPGTRYYDAGFNVVSAPEQDGFLLSADVTDDGAGLYDVTLTVARVDGEPLLSLRTAHFKGGD